MPADAPKRILILVENLPVPFDRRVWMQATTFPDEQVLEWLSTADVCVAPDPKDALNDISSFNKIVEYMAVGKPIVAFDLGEVRTSAGAAALYVAANDVAAFGGAVLELLDDPDRRRDMGAAGRHRFETVLAWEHQEARLLAMYRDLLGAPA